MAVSPAVSAGPDQVVLGRTSFKEKVIVGVTPTLGYLLVIGVKTPKGDVRTLTAA